MSGRERKGAGGQNTTGENVDKYKTIWWKILQP